MLVIKTDYTLYAQYTLTAAIYDEAGYDLSIDYGQPPPPDFSLGDQNWMRTLLGHAQA
jgi:hypothetical protein